MRRIRRRTLTEGRCGMRPRRRPVFMHVALAALAVLLLSGCRADISQSVILHPFGTADLLLSVTVDDELFAMMRQDGTTPPASQNPLTSSSPAASRLRHLIQQAHGSITPVDSPGAHGVRAQVRNVSLAMATELLAAFATAVSAPPRGQTMTPMSSPAGLPLRDTPSVADTVSWGLWTIVHRTTVHIPAVGPEGNPFIRSSAELRVPWPLESTTGTLVAPDTARLEGAGDLVVTSREPNMAGRMGLALLTLVALFIVTRTARRRAGRQP